MPHTFDLEQLKLATSNDELSFTAKIKLKLAGYNRHYRVLGHQPALPMISKRQTYHKLPAPKISRVWLSPEKNEVAHAIGLISCGMFAYRYPSGHIFAYHAASSSLGYDIFNPPNPPCEIPGNQQASQVQVILASPNPVDDIGMDETIKTLMEQGILEDNIYVYSNAMGHFAIDSQGCVGYYEDGDKVWQRYQLQYALLGRMDQAIERYESQDGFKHSLLPGVFFSGFHRHTKSSTIAAKAYLEAAISQKLDCEAVEAGVIDYFNSGPGSFTDCSLKHFFLKELENQPTDLIQKLLDAYRRTQPSHPSIK